MSGLLKLLKKLKHAPFSPEPNALKIPVTKLHYNSDNIELFNAIYLAMLKEEKRYNVIQRTTSGGISLKTLLSERYRMWDLRQSDVWIEMTIINPSGCWRIQMAPGRQKDSPILSGRKAYFMFDAFLKKFNIELSDYAISNGALINKFIPKPLIFLNNEALTSGTTFEHVNHIDFHNSYPAGLANTHPEFREAIDYLYNNRHRKPEYKDLLNYSIGFFHSKYTKYRYAGLARDAITDSNNRVIELANRVEKTGRTILLFNTDGFWYVGKPYHGEGEGTKLGEWHNDHIDCKFRAKSMGSYEFIENEEYTPVVRGYTKLDDIKDRANWEWGDIYQKDADVKNYKFIEGKGIVEV